MMDINQGSCRGLSGRVDKSLDSEPRGKGFETLLYVALMLFGKTSISICHTRPTCRCRLSGFLVGYNP